jgi:hypothetical protein
LPPTYLDPTAPAFYLLVIKRRVDHFDKGNAASRKSRSDYRSWSLLTASGTKELLHIVVDRAFFNPNSQTAILRTVEFDISHPAKSCDQFGLKL